MTPELKYLIRQLEKIASPAQRMRFLARSWRAVRTLSAGDRRELAKRVGLDGAEGLLQRLGRQRGGAVADLADLVRDVREGPPEEMESEPESEPEPEPEPEPEQEEADELVPMPQVVSGPEPAPAPAPKPVLPAAVAVPVVVVESSSPPPPPEELTEPEPAREPEPELESDPRLVEELQTGETTLQRLRHLRANLDRARGLDNADLGALLEAFPEGWARRRALTALLGEGIPADADEAEMLISSLPGAASRRWCTAVLAHRPVAGSSAP